MIKEGKFGVHEAVCLLTITIGSKIFFTSPAFLIRFVGTAGWYMTLISNFTSILAFTFIYILLKRYPGNNIVEIFDSSVGRIFGFLFSLAFGLSFFQGAGVILREFSEVLRAFTYPDTPTSLIIGGVTIAVFIAAYLGLESIARVSKLFAYVLLFGLIMILILGASNYNYKYLFPILGNGLDKTFIHGIKRSSAYTEVAVLAVFAGSLQGIGNVKKAGYISLILSGIIYSATLVCMIMTFPYVTLQELTSPMYFMTRLIKYGTFFQRLDSIFLLIWTISSFITVSVLFYSAVSVYCKMFRLQDTRPVAVPMALLLFTSAMAPRDFSSIVYGTVQQIRENGWIIFYGLPLIALITAVLRKKKGGKVNA